jgi:putative tricarboxylic transport membrane protein
MISYAQAKNAAKDPSKFGTGVYEGVIAAETANNATIGGALIIALTLGIPGDPPTAVLLGGLMVHGLEPGPTLLLNYPDLVYGIYFSVFFASFTMMTILLVLMRPISRVVEVPKKILLPALFVLASTAVYSIDYEVFDVLVMCTFGGIGYALERFRYPLPPFILGLLLGPLIESNFRRMLGSDGSLKPLFTSPIALTFLILSAGSIAYSLYKHRVSGS